MAPMTRSDDEAVGDAWRRLSAPTAVSAGSRFTAARIERALRLVVAVGAMATGGQAMIAARDHSAEMGRWGLVLIAAAIIPLGALIVACLINRWVVPTASVFAIIFPIILLVKPFVASHELRFTERIDVSWPWYLLNVATAAAILAFRPLWQVIWTVGIPALFILGYAIQADFSLRLVLQNLMVGSFSLILGGIILMLVWLLRSMAAGVDVARTHAIAAYARAAEQEAIEQEKIELAALMHDSVIAALLAAERADSPRERQLAVGMAREALSRLADVDDEAVAGSDQPYPLHRLADELEASAAEMGVPVRVSRVAADATVPERVARAVGLAATQAVSNAILHAEGEGLAISLAGARAMTVAEEVPPSVVVTIRDSGPGFDPSSIPLDRLGIRASIVARLAAIDGTSDIQTDHRGTVVRLSWRGDLS